MCALEHKPDTQVVSWLLRHYSERLEDVVRERYLRLSIHWTLLQHPGLLVTFTSFTSESLVEADPDCGGLGSCWSSGQLPSMVGIGLKEVGLLSGANIPPHKKDLLCKEINTNYRYSGCPVSSLSACQ